MQTYILTVWAVWIWPTESSEFVRRTFGTLDSCIAFGNWYGQILAADGVVAWAWSCVEALAV